MASDLLEALGVAAARRATGAPCCDEVVDCYARLWAQFPRLEAIAQAHVRPALARVLQESEAVEALMQVDPAAPGLEEEFLGALGELSALAAVFAGDPERGAEASDDYRDLCRLISRLLRAVEPVAPMWALLRRTKFASRARPPARPPCLAPLADDTEYYM